MKQILKIAKLLACALLLLGETARAVISPTTAELAQKGEWVRQNLLTTTNRPPFSFTYNGQSSSVVLAAGVRSEKAIRLDANRTRHVITWSTKTLEVSCVATEYSDYPLVQWTVYFRNTGAENTHILESIQGLDTHFECGTGQEFVLNGIKGDSTTADSYEPYALTLRPSTITDFSPLSYSGKSCSGPKGWPYYNLQMSGGGVVMTVGWPGQWASSFKCDAVGDLQIDAGQQLTHLYLKPGEQIRTPLIALMFWQGTNVVRAQNLWRHFYLAHVIPRVNGRLPSTVLQVQGDSIGIARSYLQAGIKPDVLWRDAGGGPGTTWYPSRNGPYQGNDSWLNTGTWEVDPGTYPLGFKPLSDWLHAHGMKFLLWFEPERVGDSNSWLAKNHPEWLLPGEAHGMGATTLNDGALHAENEGNTHGSILNEGDPAVFHWLTNQVEQLIKSQGIDWYREDMNGDGPLPAWRNKDAPDRQGITENFYVQGHLAYWDALLAMNPGLRIDSCASGGRRNDLESMRRAVPLTRSDFLLPSMANVVNGNQCHTYGLSSWLPFQGSGSFFNDPYSFRSFYLPQFGMVHGITADNTAAEQQAYAECKKVAPIMLNGDYYPLTPYSLSDDVWMAWQFDRPDTGQGFVQAFRRGKCDQSTEIFRLSGLDPTAHYEIRNFDLQESIISSGRNLMESGLTVKITDQPGAAIISYQRIGALSGSSPP
jgi:alpha-galactosidase